MGSFDVPLDDERTQLDAFVEEYRTALEVTLDRLTEEQARRHLGLVQNPEESFRLTGGDTIASVPAAHREACATARTVVADLPLDTVVTGHRTGPRTLRWVYLQVLRELAHHCGHADILREQVLAG
jgi:Protein of unknown function (DUF664)